jgi:hypothetical protein
MATVKVPGLDKSKGMQSGFTAYVEGEYALEINSVELVESKKSAGTSWVFKHTILEGPNQDDGKAPDGRKLTTRIFIMGEDHPSEEQWGHIGVDELESMRMAAGVDKKGSSINPQDFVGEKVRAILRVKEEPAETKDGVTNPYAGQKRNEVREWRAYK